MQIRVNFSQCLINLFTMNTKFTLKEVSSEERDGNKLATIRTGLMYVIG